MPVVREIPNGHGDLAYVVEQPADPLPPYVVTMSFASATAPTVQNLNDIWGDFHGQLLLNVSAAYDMLRVEALYRQADGMLVSIASDRASEPFQHVGNPAPQNCAVLVQKRTGFAGRAFRGRMYVPGIPEGDIENNGALSPAAFAAWNTAVDQHLTFFSTILAPVLIHSCFHTDEEPVCVPPVPTPVTALDVDGVIATQRRRLR